MGLLRLVLSSKSVFIRTFRPANKLAEPTHRNTDKQEGQPLTGQRSGVNSRKPAGGTPLQTQKGIGRLGAVLGEMRGGAKGRCLCRGRLVGLSASAMRVPPKSTGHWDSICWTEEIGFRDGERQRKRKNKS